MKKGFGCVLLPENMDNCLRDKDFWCQRGLALASLFDDMQAKLSGYDAGNLADAHADHGFLKGFDHLARSKPVQVAALAFAGAGRILARQ